MLLDPITVGATVKLERGVGVIEIIVLGVEIESVGLPRLGAGEVVGVGEMVDGTLMFMLNVVSPFTVTGSS